MPFSTPVNTSFTPAHHVRHTISLRGPNGFCASNVARICQRVMILMEEICLVINGATHGGPSSCRLLPIVTENFGQKKKVLHTVLSAVFNRVGFIKWLIATYRSSFPPDLARRSPAILSYATFLHEPLKPHDRQRNRLTRMGEFSHPVTVEVIHRIFSIGDCRLTSSQPIAHPIRPSQTRFDTIKAQFRLIEGASWSETWRQGRWRGKGIGLERKTSRHLRTAARCCGGGPGAGAFPT